MFKGLSNLKKMHKKVSAWCIGSQITSLVINDCTFSMFLAGRQFHTGSVSDLVVTYRNYNTTNGAKWFSGSVF